MSPHETMRGWKHRIDINRYLSDETLTNGDCALLVQEVLERNRYWFMSLAGSRIKGVLAGLREAAGNGDWDRYDEMLGHVYDLADQHRIWLG